MQVTSPLGNAFSEDERDSVSVPRNSYADRKKVGRSGRARPCDSRARGAPLQLESQVAEMVSRINSTYGSLTFRPVHHIHQVAASRGAPRRARA